MLDLIIKPSFYELLSRFSALVIPILLKLRTLQGKEDFLRKNERKGFTNLTRPNGVLLWIHASSVGEALGALPLINNLSEKKNLTILVTTGTVTSALILKGRLPKTTIHQYVPLDYIGAVKRFLNHWKPDIALWIESELWPNLILQTAKRDIPMVLVNARISDRSAERWSKIPLLSKPILRAFSLILAQTSADKEKLISLGAQNVRLTGNIKFDSSKLPVDVSSLEKLQLEISNRPCWLAASTHPGEEDIVAKAHKTIASKHPSVLTILCPRHPSRGSELVSYLKTLNLKVAQRSQQDPITTDTDIYLADTLGELGLFYRLSSIAFIGGSLVPMHGHNPIEAAQLGCAIISGPDMRNFYDADTILSESLAMIKVNDEIELSAAVDNWLSNESDRANAEKAATKCLSLLTGALDKTLVELEPILNQQLGVRKK